METIKQIVKVI